MAANDRPLPEGPDDPTEVEGVPVRVRVDHEHEIVREGLAAMLELHPDRVTLVPPEEVGRVSVVVHGAEDVTPTDLARVREAAEAEHLVLLTMTWARPVTVDLRLVSAQVGEDVDADGLVDTIERVAAGESIPRQGIEPPATPDLSDQERLVVSLVTAGLSNKQVAEVAFLSVNTVKSHIRSAYSKMGVTNRSQAVLWGLRHELQPIARLADEVARYDGLPSRTATVQSKRPS